MPICFVLTLQLNNLQLTLQLYNTTINYTIYGSLFNYTIYAEARFQFRIGTPASISGPKPLDENSGVHSHQCTMLLFYFLVSSLVWLGVNSEVRHFPFNHNHLHKLCLLCFSVPTRMHTHLHTHTSDVPVQCTVQCTVIWYGYIWYDSVRQMHGEFRYGYGTVQR